MRRARVQRATAGGRRRRGSARAAPARPGARAPSAAAAAASGGRAATRAGRRARSAGSRRARGASPKRKREVTSSTSAPARASAAASSWSYGGVNAGGSARTTRIARTLVGLALLVRSWNVFHGNAARPAGAADLRRWCGSRPPTPGRRVPAGGAGLGAAAARRLERDDRALGRRAPRRSLPAHASRRAITRLHHGLFRSVFTGQANAILSRPALDAARAPWACGSTRAVASGASATPSGSSGSSSRNLHATNDFARPEVAARRAPPRRGVRRRVSRRGCRAVLAGDFNVRAEHLHELERLVGARARRSTTCSSAGSTPSPLRVWPRERRRRDGRRALRPRAGRGARSDDVRGGARALSRCSSGSRT